MNELSYHAVSEEVVYINLPGTDGLKIKGLLRGSFDMPLVIIMHGLTGEANELLPYLSARYLYEQGFASLRLYMYDSDPKTRDLVDCTLQTHADDFEVVVDYLRSKNVLKLFAVGHSYGGATVLLAKSKLDGAVLWDPSHGLAFRSDSPKSSVQRRNAARQEETNDLNVYLGGAGYVLPKAVTKEQKELGDTTVWAAHKNYPLKIISAGEGILAEFGEQYRAIADEPKARVVIEGAHHNFEDSDKVVMQLFKETTDWLKEYS